MVNIDWDKIQGHFRTVGKIKKIMQKKQLRRSRCVCPHCKTGMINARLVGHRDHIHASCTTPYCLVIVE